MIFASRHSSVEIDATTVMQGEALHKLLQHVIITYLCRHLRLLLADLCTQLPYLRQRPYLGALASSCLSVIQGGDAQVWSRSSTLARSM